VNTLFWIVIASAILSGFFALAGYAFRFVRRGQLEKILPPARLGLIDTLDKHDVALQMTASLCRAAANMVLVIAMVYLLDGSRLGLARTVLALALAVVIIAVVGLSIPHAWAAYSAPRITVITLPVMLAIRYALYPLVALMQAFDLPIRRLSDTGDEPQAPGEIVKEEILSAAANGRQEGTVAPDEMRMIEGVMDFAHSDTGRIMTPRTDIFALPADMPWNDAAAKIVQAGHTRVPIYELDLDNIIGIIYVKDLLAYINQPPPKGLKEIMRKPFFVPETMVLPDLLREFKARKVHIAIVLDEYGGTAGLVSIEDVLEEIVGDISDEYDHAEPALMRRTGPTAAEIDGRLLIDDLNDAMGLSIPENENYDTVAGFVFSQLGYIPGPGETLVSHGAKFTILAATERKISKLRIELAPQEKRET
jgi:CBS domain containing-hemolysin-like protein